MIIHNFFLLQSSGSEYAQFGDRFGERPCKRWKLELCIQHWVCRHGCITEATDDASFQKLTISLRCERKVRRVERRPLEDGTCSCYCALWGLIIITTTIREGDRSDFTVLRSYNTAYQAGALIGSFWFDFWPKFRQPVHWKPFRNEADWDRRLYWRM